MGWFGPQSGNCSCCPPGESTCNCLGITIDGLTNGTCSSCASVDGEYRVHGSYDPDTGEGAWYGAPSGTAESTCYCDASRLEVTLTNYRDLTVTLYDCDHEVIIEWTYTLSADGCEDFNPPGVTIDDETATGTGACDFSSATVHIDNLGLDDEQCTVGSCNCYDDEETYCGECTKQVSSAVLVTIPNFTTLGDCDHCGAIGGTYVCEFYSGSPCGWSYYEELEPCNPAGVTPCYGYSVTARIVYVYPYYYWVVTVGIGRDSYCMSTSNTSILLYQAIIPPDGMNDLDCWARLTLPLESETQNPTVPNCTASGSATVEMLA